MDTMEGFHTFQKHFPRFLTSRKEKSLDREIYVKLTYDLNVKENMHVKRTTDVRTI